MVSSEQREPVCSIFCVKTVCWVNSCVLVAGPLRYWGAIPVWTHLANPLWSVLCTYFPFTPTWQENSSMNGYYHTVPSAKRNISMIIHNASWHSSSHWKKPEKSSISAVSSVFPLFKLLYSQRSTLHALVMEYSKQVYPHLPHRGRNWSRKLTKKGSMYGE